MLQGKENCRKTEKEIKSRKPRKRKWRKKQKIGSAKNKQIRK